MSQLQVTGEAKIRDIQGPVVANSGVITALDGAASQYVRGDGTLADFPTSSGGGSSVSYYLNSSVSQGTIGGVAYRELSKDPIIGAGTDLAIASNGYIASYITDANDPDVVLVPGGNFNCEFYFSVNNNTGNPFTYAELYKYDGTNFTLLGSSVGVPESINQGTTIAPYYFAIPVATAALALTDRLAIRIYVNVDGRIVTLHTENGHLCQVVTTLSKGMVSLNNLTDQSQFLTTGTAGMDFNIVSSGDTHTFNLPSASATNRGLITTGSQTIAGSKTFSSTTLLNSVYIDGLSYLKHQASSGGGIAGYTVFNALSNGVIEYIFPTLFKSVLDFNDGADYTYTFPAASGTIALTSNLSSYVPYTGATASVDLGYNSLIATGVTSNLMSTHILEARVVTNTSGSIFLRTGTIGYNSGTNAITLVSSPSVANTLIISSDVSSVTKTALIGLGSLTATRTFTLPDLSGTLALLEGSQTFSGLKTFDLGLLLKEGVIPSAVGYTGLSGDADGLVITKRVGSTAYTNLLYFNSATSNTYTFPNLSGTLALLEGAQTFSGYKTFSNGLVASVLQSTSGIILSTTVQVTPSSPSIAICGRPSGLEYRTSTNVNSLIFQAANYTYTFPAATGTIALTSNLSGYLPLTGGTLTGALTGTSATFGGLLTANSGTTNNTNAITIAAATTAKPHIGSGFGATFIQNNNYYNGSAYVYDDNTIGSTYITLNDTIAFGTGAANTIPSTKLTIANNGAATFSSSVTAGGNITMNGTTLIGGGTNLRLVANTAGAFTAVYGDTGGLYLGTNAGNWMFINNTGNVGIGTISPISFGSTFNNLTTSGSTGSFVLTTNSTNSIIGQVGVDDTLVYYGSRTNHAVTFSTNTIERIRITTAGNVGIGTSSPAQALSIDRGASSGYIQLTAQSSNLYLGQDSTGAAIISDRNAPMYFQVNGSERLRITSNGTIGFNGSADVNNASGIDKLSIGYLNSNYGWIQTWNATNLYLNKIGNAVYAGTQRIDNNSDQRIKENIAPIENALDVVLSLNGRKFNMLDEDNILRYGFVAQEVQPHLADFVTESDRIFEKGDIKIENLLTLESSGSAWGALLVEAIKEQQAQIEELKALINK